MKLTEKASYLKGLSDGLDYDKTTAQGKLLSALIDLTAEMAQELDRLDEDCEYLSDYCEELDEDLGDVETVLLDCFDDEDDLEYEDDYDEELDDDELEDFEDEEFYETECPVCGATIEFDASIDPAKLTCPKCGKQFSLEITAEELEELKEMESFAEPTEE